MRTAQEKPISKEKIMDVASELMLTKGYVATTVDEICQQAKLTKGSFFHYFSSKEELAKALLTRTCTKAQEALDALYGSDPLKRTFGHIDMAIAFTKSVDGGKGCLKGTLAQELSDTHPQIRKLCVQSFESMAADFAKDLTNAKAKHAPKASFDPPSVAKHFIAILQGSLILVKAYQDKSVMVENLEHFKAYVKELLKQ